MYRPSSLVEICGISGYLSILAGKQFHNLKTNLTQKGSQNKQKKPLKRL